MIHECRRDVFAALGKADAMCITTNGFVKKDGGAVMGRGVVLTARERFPGIDRELVAMTRPECENGCLEWPDVKPTLERYLDERFWVCTP